MEDEKVPLYSTIMHVSISGWTPSIKIMKRRFLSTWNSVRKATVVYALWFNIKKVVTSGKTWDLKNKSSFLIGLEGYSIGQWEETHVFTRTVMSIIWSLSKGYIYSVHVQASVTFPLNHMVIFPPTIRFPKRNWKVRKENRSLTCCQIPNGTTLMLVSGTPLWFKFQNTGLSVSPT